MTDLDALKENLETALRIDRNKLKIHADTIAHSNKKIPLLLKEFDLKRNIYSIITLDMTIELAEMLHISTEEAYGILLALSNLIEKRTMEGKISVIDDLFMVFPTKHKLPKDNVFPTTLRMVANNGFKKRIRQKFIPTWNKDTPNHIANEKLRNAVITDIINKISEKRRLNVLLADLFGYNKSDAID